MDRRIKALNELLAMPPPPPGLSFVGESDLEELYELVRKRLEENPELAEGLELWREMYERGEIEIPPPSEEEGSAAAQAAHG